MFGFKAWQGTPAYEKFRNHNSWICFLGKICMSSAITQLQLMGQTLLKNKSKRRLDFDSEEYSYFIRNGLLLEKQISLTRGQHSGELQLKIFSTQDLKRGTNNYDPNLIVGRVRSTVYKGTLDNHPIVAVKGPIQQEPNHEVVDFFLTEASIAMVMNHDNILKIYGCCLMTPIPILVYEYLPNGSLFQHLYGTVSSSSRIKWVDLLRVVTDAAYALSYMHNALSMPVVHRDFQSLNILLDDSFHAKLSNFGYSVAITPGETTQRWPIEGTPGYIDPEYIETQKVTDKCDVYSFGVFLLELLTRRQPFMMAKEGVDLVDLFVSAVEKNCTMEMMNKEVLEQTSRDDILQIVQIALTCVAKKGAERPTMIEVVRQLWKIQG